MVVAVSEYKELPNLTKNQKAIIDFWSIRGYESITHALGMNIKLHKKKAYFHTGLDLQYLEQFQTQAKLEGKEYATEKCLTLICNLDTQYNVDTLIDVIREDLFKIREELKPPKPPEQRGKNDENS